jgi:hypothetical protein
LLFRQTLLERGLTPSPNGIALDFFGGESLIPWEEPVLSPAEQAARDNALIAELLNPEA